MPFSDISGSNKVRPPLLGVGADPPEASGGAGGVPGEASSGGVGVPGVEGGTGVVGAVGGFASGGGGGGGGGACCAWTGAERVEIPPHNKKAVSAAIRAGDDSVIDNESFSLANQRQEQPCSTMSDALKQKRITRQNLQGMKGAKAAEEQGLVLLGYYG